ncbi:MAG: hypothetical protein WDA65_00375 [Christensenellales bacterium]
MSPTLGVVLRFLWYFFSRLIIAGMVVGLVMLSFLAAMDYMNVQVLIKDGLNLRADVIIKGNDPTPLTRVFSKNFLENDIPLNTTTYRSYIISSYEYNAKVGFAVIFPWHNTVTLRVTEEVSKIRGELYVMLDNTEKLSETPPEWDNAVYDITLMRFEDNWRIISLELVELLPKPPPLYEPLLTPAYEPVSTGTADIEETIED